MRLSRMAIRHQCHMTRAEYTGALKSLGDAWANGVNYHSAHRVQWIYAVLAASARIRVAFEVLV